MEWTKKDITDAFRIFFTLLKDGIIEEDNSELRYAYQRSEVRQLLEDIIEKEAEVKIFSAKGNIYLTPGLDNRFFGYKNLELLKKMKLNNNTELYLAYFVILVLISKFYNSEDQSLASRQFLPIEELEKTITSYIENISDRENDEIKEIEEELSINLKSISEVWMDIPSFDDTIKNLRRAKNNRISFLIKVMDFLEEESLIQVLEDYTIRPLPKMEYLIIRYYFHNERKEMLLSYLNNEINNKV
ncbi:DUF6063 family protein [Natronospora cellulosivora (SeqCode)]